MKFGPVPLAGAAGTILAHSLRVEGRRIAKGTVLTDDIVALLTEAGYGEVTVAELEPGELDENEAAQAVAHALATDELTPLDPARGRANLVATADGLLDVDADALLAANRIDEAVTVATRPPWTPLAAGDVAASVKIITFGVSEASVEAIAGLPAPPFRLHPFRPLSALLIQTEQPDGDRTSVLRKSRRVIQEHLDGIGASLDAAETCSHTVEAVADCLDRKAADRDVVLILGASSTVDRRDVAPSALEAAGGEVVHLGMPVDPGNLSMVGRLEADGRRTWVFGLPGSARSPRYHGFDLLLQRAAAGLDIGRDDILRLAAGGLLKEAPTAGKSRAAREDMPPARPVAALLLAAGASTRMGADNKLLKEIDGVPLVRRTAETLASSRAAAIILVTGHEADAISAATSGLPVETVLNPDHAEGLSTSLKAGLEAVPPDTAGVLVCLADMPDLDTGLIDRMIDAFETAPPGADAPIVVPVFGGRRGNPVLFDAHYLPEIRAASGDTGARDVIRAYQDRIIEIDAGDAAVLTDLDTPAAWEAWYARRQDPSGGSGDDGATGSRKGHTPR